MQHSAFSPLTFSFEKNQESNYLAESLITGYRTIWNGVHGKPEAAIKSSSNAIDLFVLIIKFLLLL